MTGRGSGMLTPEILVPRLGDYLLEKGIVTIEDLHRALQTQDIRRSNQQHPLLGQILIEMGVVDQATLDQAITEQIIQLRAALQEANQQLEHRVEERTAELQNALKKLSEVNQLKSNIVANISHELRTPLTHIKGYVELIISEGMGPLNEQQTAALKVVQRSSERLENQIEDLIQVSLSAKGELSLKITDVNLANCLKAVFQRLLPIAEDRNIMLTLSLPDELPTIHADEEKINWAIMQLVGNAIKFTQPEGQVLISAVVENGLIDIAITDNGIGIPEDRISEIFEPFHQLDGSTTRRYGGTGLGLTIVRQIIEAHGSEIKVRSKIGSGSRFEFFLAAAEGINH